MKTIIAVIAITILLAWFGPSLLDHSEEQAIAADLDQAQQKADKAAKLNQILIRQCIEDRGLGAAPVFGEDGNFLRCVARKGLK